MKFYIFVPEKLQPFYKTEMENYHTQFSKHKFSDAWHHLERAHVMVQKYPFAHSKVHWEMLKFGIKLKNTKEIMGQIPRLIFGGVKSFVGKVPIGNPGGANVPPLKPFEIEQEIIEIFKKAQII
jgi:Protein of unknown function (DUF3703)